MILSYLLFLVLFVIATLAWGLVFAFHVTRLSRRNSLYLILFASASSTFASIFILKTMLAAYSEIGFTVYTLVFVCSGFISFLIGYGLSHVPLAKRALPVSEKLFGASPKDDTSGIIDDIIERTEKIGGIEGLDRELLESVMKFNDKIVREVMIPRGDVVAIDIGEEPRQLLRKVIEEGFSRLPVYRNSIDNIVGIIYAKDLLTMVEDGAVIVLQDLIRIPYYVPESMKISQLLRDMQKNKVHLAVVVDEFGGTEGIVTLEDVLEEIVGEIQDEYDESSSELVTDSNGDAHFSGSMAVARFNELLHANVPESDDYETMAGFVQKLAGKLPQEGEIYNYEEMLFTIEEVAKHRIKKLRAGYREHPAQAAQENAAEHARFRLERQVAPVEGEKTANILEKRTRAVKKTARRTGSTAPRRNRKKGNRNG